MIINSLNNNQIPIDDEKTGLKRLNKMLASQSYLYLRQRILRAFSISAACNLPVLALLVIFPVQAATDLTRFSLEELLSIEVTSVAKKNQRISEAAAAVHVITREDIRRSGMTSIPELLRQVPGLQVAQINASKWAISSRGFNSFRSNKLLVMMDGRTLYSPLFSGAYWDVQDTNLEDIERIEVIHGPGGTLWGANAVNGVINIITRHSRDTQGGLVSALLGDQESGATLRYGSSLGEDGSFRAYAKLVDRDSFVDTAGGATNDAWDMQKVGFRVDWESSSRDSLNLQGDIYKGDAEQTIGILDNVSSPTQFQQDNADLSGGNLLLSWHRTLTEDSDWKLQTYVDRNERDDASLKQRIDTFDLSFQHRFPITESQELTWGLGYRRIEDTLENSFTVSFDPASFNQSLYSIFIQDEISLRDDLRLTLGTKLEHNDFTNSEYQPSIRLLWLVEENHSLWGAVSRAVRTPSRSDRDIRINFLSLSLPFVDPDGPGPLVAGDPTLFSLFGNKSMESEELLAYELGYQGQLRPSLTLDMATFYNVYDKLFSVESGFGIEGTPPTNALIYSIFDNQLSGESYGLELVVNWQAISNWRLRFGYSWMKVAVRLDAGSTDNDSISDQEDSTPRQQAQLRSSWNIRDNLELDTALYYVDDIEVRGSTGLAKFPAYTRLDIRLGWLLRDDLELSLVGQNLLEDKHPEFTTPEVISSEVPRSLYGQIKLKF